MTAGAGATGARCTMAEQGGNRMRYIMIENGDNNEEKDAVMIKITMGMIFNNKYFVINS